jgi:hypothetical protein
LSLNTYGIALHVWVPLQLCSIDLLVMTSVTWDDLSYLWVKSFWRLLAWVYCWCSCTLTYDLIVVVFELVGILAL